MFHLLLCYLPISLLQRTKARMEGSAVGGERKGPIPPLCAPVERSRVRMWSQDHIPSLLQTADTGTCWNNGPWPPLNKLDSYTILGV